MSETLFEYQTRIRDEEVLYLLRGLADHFGIIPFAEKDRRMHVDPDWDGWVSEDPHSAVEMILNDPGQKPEEAAPTPEVEIDKWVEDNGEKRQLGKCDSVLARYNQERTYFKNKIEANPNDPIAKRKHREACSLAQSRHNAINAMIQAGTCRYLVCVGKRTNQYKLEALRGGVWVNWDASFVPEKTVKSRGPRKSTP